MPIPDIRPAQLTSVGLFRRPVTPSHWFAVLFASCGLLAGMAGACTQRIPGEAGDACNGQGDCKAGLRCSYDKKRCYAPVDCDRLDKRLTDCTPELLATAYPSFRKLQAARRVALLRQVTEHLRSSVVKSCRYDAWAEARKQGKTPLVKRSWGEDPRARQMNACLTKERCADFARCILEEARLLGPRAPRPDRLRVLPLALHPLARRPPSPAGKPARNSASPARDSASPARPNVPPQGAARGGTRHAARGGTRHAARRGTRHAVRPAARRAH